MDSILSQEGRVAGVSLYFVVPKTLTELTCSAHLRSAFQACIDERFSCVWCDEQEVVAMAPGPSDVFVLDPFEGPAFNHVTSSAGGKSVVLGPQCLLACLQSCEQVPNLGYPLYTAVLRDTVVACTGFERTERVRIGNLVRLMAGVFSKDFHEECTHLLAAAVGSDKYKVAVERDIPVLSISWLHQLWTDSCDSRLTRLNDLDLHEFRCPPLLGLHVCVSQMSRADKDFIKKIVENNGGVYMAQLQAEKTSILITPSIEGEKASFARKWQIPCVTSDWLYDSVERLICLPFDRYSASQLARLASTPANNKTAKLDRLSVSSIKPASGPAPMSETLNVTADHKAELAQFDATATSELLSAGQYLDGCKVHLMGFDTAREEKLRRVLNAAGAVRLAGPLSSVTHVLVAPGTAPPANLERLEQPPAVVSLGWLLESWLSGRPRSPRRTLSPDPAPGPDEPVLEEEEPLQGPQDPEVALTENTSDSRSVFQGTRFRLSPLLERGEAVECRRILTQHGGVIVSDGRAFHVVAPLVSISMEEGGGGSEAAEQYLSQATHGAVTIGYLQHCVEKDELLEVEYYHRPVLVPGPAASSLLSDCVLAISCYAGRERQYLALVGESLGAAFQEVFARRDNASRGVRASTLLVCPTADGNKCRAALRWGVPVVSCRWLLACLKEARRVDTAEYSVTLTNTTVIQDAPGDSTALGILPPAAVPVSTPSAPVDPPSHDPASTAHDPHVAADTTLLRRQNSPGAASTTGNVGDSVSGVETTSSRALKRPLPSENRTEDEEVLSPLKKRAANDQTPSMAQQLHELKTLVDLRCTSVSAADSALPLPLPHHQQEGGESRDVLEVCHAVLTDSEVTTVDHDVDTQGSGDVTWNDARECQARRQLLADSEPEAPASSPLASPPHPLPDPSTDKPHVFAFSGFETNERQRLCDLVKGLGAEVCEAPSLDAAVTHLVTARPNRSEKHLVCIAAGLWLLRPEYLQQCERQGRFLHAEPFEWSTTADKMPAKSVEHRVSMAATRWRKRIQQGLPGAFHNMVAVLLTSPSDRLLSFRRLITAGAGRCVDIDALSSVPSPVTHVLMEPARVDSSVPTEHLWRQLQRLHVPCLAPIFLNEFLMNDTPPPVHQFYVEKFKQFVSR